MKMIFIKIVFGMYINYFFLGMVNIILVFNMFFLMKQWNIDLIGISYVIVVIGFGKLLIYGIFGVLLDKIGRKLFVVVFVGIMVVFLVGIFLLLSYELVFVFVLLVGVVNLVMDVGIYLVLIEFFLVVFGLVNVLVKVFMFVGVVLLLFLIIFLLDYSLFYGFVFYFFVVVYVLNIVYLLMFLFFKKQKLINSG